MDSTGLRMLDDLARRYEARGAAVRILAPPDVPARYTLDSPRGARSSLVGRMSDALARLSSPRTLPTTERDARSALLACLLALAVAPAAGAATYAPPRRPRAQRRRRRLLGLRLRRAHRRGPAVVQSFVAYNGSTSWAFDLADSAARARDAAHRHDEPVGRRAREPGRDRTRRGRPLAGGLNRTIAQRGEPVYIRLMAEMNCHWNVYSAYGGRHDAAHSTKAYHRRLAADDA